MKKFAFYALCAVMLFTLCSCFAGFGPSTQDGCRDDNHDGMCDAHYHKVHGGYIHWDDNSDGYCDKCEIKLHISNMHEDVNNDLICDFCYAELENGFVNCFDYDQNGCCDACGCVIRSKGECAILAPTVRLTVPDSKSDKSATNKISVNISTLLDVYDTVTSATVISDSFTASNAEGVAWDENTSFDVELTHGGIEESGEIIFKITTDWKYSDPADKEFDISHVAVIKIFYATDDECIAFSTISANDAEDKLKN